MRTIWKPSAIAMSVLVGMFTSVGSAQAATLNFNRQANLVQPAPFPQNKQNEPSITQNPTNALNLVAGANDEIDAPGCTSPGCPFVTTVGGSGVYLRTAG